MLGTGGWSHGSLIAFHVFIKPYTRQGVESLSTVFRELEFSSENESRDLGICSQLLYLGVQTLLPLHTFTQPYECNVQHNYKLLEVKSFASPASSK